MVIRLLGLQILLGLDGACRVLLASSSNGIRATMAGSANFKIDVWPRTEQSGYDLIYITPDPLPRAAGEELSEILGKVVPLLHCDGYCCVGFYNRWSLRYLVSLLRCVGRPSSQCTSWSLRGVTDMITRHGLQVHQVLSAWPDHHGLKFLAPRKSSSIKFLFLDMQAGSYGSRINRWLHSLAARSGCVGLLTNSYVVVAGKPG